MTQRARIPFLKHAGGLCITVLIEEESYIDPNTPIPNPTPTPPTKAVGALGFLIVLGRDYNNKFSNFTNYKYVQQPKEFIKLHFFAPITKPKCFTQLITILWAIIDNHTVI